VKRLSGLTDRSGAGVLRSVLGSRSNQLGLLSATIRRGNPDFLDLPWDQPFESWKNLTPRHEELPRGLSRHPVNFVGYDGVVYALKELPPAIAVREHDVLRELEDRRLPSVRAVGHARIRRADGEHGVIITRYLERSLPYHALFMSSSLVRYREYLLDAMAGLLVQLHLAGVFWGDCSLSNTLFRRDAGRLTAYLVDAETSEAYERDSDGMRQHDLDIMQENVCGGLLDLHAMDALPPHFPVYDIGPYIRGRYKALWHQVTHEEIIGLHERYRIEERVRALNDMGFSVEQIELLATEAGDQLRLRALVTDRNYHRDMLHSLTGLDPEEMQARQLLNEIHERRATLSARENRSMSLSAAAHAWLNETFRPTIARIAPALRDGMDPAEAYCQLLEHKWFMSERVQRDVGLAAAIEDFLRRFA
jgi:hypothetical protein